MTAITNLLDYQIIEQIYAGSRTIVYRGIRQSAGADSSKDYQQPVVIKILRNQYPTFSELVQFRNQYTIAKNLNQPGIIQTYNLEPYQNGYALVMEDFGGISLKEWILKKEYPLSVREFLILAIAISETLQILYRERIIHKDIKPSNILINPQTKQVKLIDFSIASLLPRETQTLINLNVLEGTLAYISPEQTGRMNRGIDYRTDFYSLGVTFYELLTGKLPFQSNDPMELVHCHIAKTAPLLQETNPEIPLVISEIVSKLMAKNVEDRYQSALGLKYDLEKCLCQLKETGEIHSFEIGRRDVCDRFLIPDKLYGRETEVETLLQAFERVSLGATEMMLVAGFSGIGKTAVVNEVHKPIVKQRGYFIKGKFDQFQRNIPFSAFVQAFRDLMGQLLTESDLQLERWRKQILAALGENGQVIIEVIPELERIIGKQPSVPELSGSAAQNCFNLLFEKFIQVFATKEHPLVIFIDDLQWADSASLKLMHLLMSKTDSQYLLAIGAYRNNEVLQAHPLMLMLQELEKTKATINTITLVPLNRASTNQLVADTLSCYLNLALPLTELVMNKTKGNPFFTTQFLKALYEDGLITFNFEGNYWQCDITQVRSLSLTDNVVEFMAMQLLKLPLLTQKILKLAACIGAQFDLNTLAIVSEQTQTDVAAALWKALQEGLILPISEVYKFYQQESIVNSQLSFVDEVQKTSDRREQLTVTYKFLHDRVQQAAYSLIPDDQKEATHLKIGQLLLEKTPLNNRAEKLFDIVNHLNAAQSLITQASQRDQLAQLNLAAGQKARSATAYNVAMAYFTTGIDLLSSDRWQHQYNLSLSLYQGATEAAFLTTNFEQMNLLAETVLTHAHSWLDRVTTYEVKIQASKAQNQFLEALRMGQEILEQLGVHLPEQPTQIDIEQAFKHTQTILGNRSIESLLELPKMTAPEQQAAMSIVSYMMSAAYQVAPGLLSLLTFVQVDLSVQYGNATESTYAYVQYGLMLIGILKDVDAGYRFGQLGINLLERIDVPKLAAKTVFGFNVSLRHWREPAQSTLEGFLQAYASGLETGDFEYVALSLMCYDYTAYFTGQELSALKQAMDEHRKIIQQLRQDSYLLIQNIYYQSILNLLEPTTEPDRLSGKDYDEEQRIQFHLEANEWLALCQIYCNKLLLSYLFHRYEQALENARLTAQYLEAAIGLMHVPLFLFYDALTWLAVYPTVSETEQTKILDRVAVHQEKLQEWETYAPSNQAHRRTLIIAERCRVLGAKAEAIESYDRAIALAKEHGYIQEEALANELAAKFYLDWGKQRIAQEYITNAYYAYARWGAKAKVADLEKRYPQLLAPILQQTRSTLSTNETIFALGTITPTTSATSTSSASVALDLAAILKASQTISSEIELSKLLSSLLRIVIENAGADKCVLMLLRDNRLLIEGSITEGTQPLVLQHLPIEESQDISLKLIYKIKHNRQPAVIVNASADLTLANDPYIICQQPKSILCSPILHQGKLIGILYLENNLATGAFTSDRVELLNLLCAQAAISLENAQLYEREQEKSQSLQASLEKLQKTEVSLAKEREFLNAIIHNITDGIVVCDASGNLTLFNKATREFHGLPMESLPPEQWAEYFSLYESDGQTPLPTTEIPLFRALQGEIVENAEMVIAPKQGSRRSLLASGQAIFDPWGNKVGAVVVMRDISDRKEAELALQQKSVELEQALHNLQNAQLQIIQSEKMSALGNLVAGVAHEMNNPLGFIAASLLETKPTIAELIEHLQLYQETFPHQSEQIIDHAEEIDLEYTLEDLPKIIDSMSAACDRLKNISTSLRTFSRADRDYKVPFNIHEGIDSTILILKHRLKANEQRPAIEVITNYGNFPLLECFPGQLNQVFMNILANAIEAIDEANIGRSFAEIKAHPNRITITTFREDEQVKIVIADNGKGMNQSVKEKIFDHLFTTKTVGKGTGLGLAIAKSIIVEKHGGSIDVNSTPSQGTEFTIILPIKAGQNN